MYIFFQAYMAKKAMLSKSILKVARSRLFKIAAAPIQDSSDKNTSNYQQYAS
jgi:hypothetical protein